MSRQRQHNDRGHSGQVLVMFAAAMIAILGFAAMAVDIGFLLAERRGVQNAADAATMAAARHIARGNDDASAEAVGYDYAELNGFSNGGDTSISLSVDADEVAATVEHEVTSFFLRAFYTGSWSVSASARAEILPDPGPFAMIALGENQGCHPSTGIRLSGTNDINVENGSIASNSCIRVDGSSLNGLIDGDIKALHGIDDSHDRLQTTPGHHKDGLSNKVVDPFDHLDAPVCSQDGVVSDDPHEDGDSYILTPGRYRNSNYTVPNNPDSLSFLPGVYCIETRVRIGSSTTARSIDSDYLTSGNVGDGGGVLFYVTGNNGEIRFNGQGSIQIRALGMLDPLFLDCTNACDENVVVWIDNCSTWDSTGGTETTLEGVIYAPCSTIELGGNAGSAVLSGMVVADAIHLHGNVELNLIADQDNPIDIPLVVLVE